MFSRRDNALHFSELKEIGRSAAHYAHIVQNGREDTPSLLIGRAFHALTLQGIEAATFDFDRKGARWEEFKAQNAGRTLLKVSEYDAVKRMRDSVFANPAAREILERCPHREVEKKWMRNGFPCSGRIDAFGDRAIAELKSTRDASRRKFLWDAQKMAYHAQLPWYDVALGTVPQEMDTDWRDQYIIATENTAPFVTVVYQLDNLRIDQGNELVEEWLLRFGACMESGEWHGYTQGVHIWDGEIRVGNDEEEEE